MPKKTIAEYKEENEKLTRQVTGAFMILGATNNTLVLIKNLIETQITENEKILKEKNDG